MVILELILLSIALSMDAFTVSICAGLTLKRLNAGQLLRPAIAFGVAHFVMIVSGWFLKATVLHFVERFDNALACLVLVGLGLKMIWDSFHPDGDDCSEHTRLDPTRGMPLLLLAVGTSMDALAVGFSTSMLHSSPWAVATCVGVSVALFTILGMKLGTYFSSLPFLENWAERLGGFFLILIGLEVYWGEMFF